MSVKSFPALAGAVCACVSGFAFATHHNDEVVVTASRHQESLDKAFVAVKVISAADIEKFQAADLNELLSRTAGVDLVTSGGRGTETSLFIRGTNSNHSLILLDGVRINSASSGSADLAHIPLSIIERIEIVRGPRAAFYGADTIGGVVQIFTKRGGHDSLDLEVTRGKHDYLRSNVALGVGDKNWDALLALGYEETDGISAKYNENPDRDGYRNENQMASLRYNLTDNTSLSLVGVEFEGDAEFDAGSANGVESSFRNRVAGLTLKSMVSDHWLLEAQASTLIYELESPHYTSFLKTERDQYSLISRHLMEPFSISWGVETYIDDVSDSSMIDFGASPVTLSTYDQTEIDNVGGFISGQVFTAVGSFEASYREDDHDVWGDHDTYSIAYSLEYVTDHRFVVSEGTAFVAPTFNQLYWPSYGNPDLYPEESKTREIFFEGPLMSWFYQASFYYTEIENLITGQPLDNRQVKIRGFELELDGSLLGFDIGMDLDLKRPWDKETRNTLARRPRRSINIDVDRTFGDFSAGFTVYAQDETNDLPYGADHLAGYGRVDIRAAYQITRNMDVGFKINNVLSKEYEENTGYNVLEEEWMVTFNLKGM